MLSHLKIVLSISTPQLRKHFCSQKILFNNLTIIMKYFCFIFANSVLQNHQPSFNLLFRSRRGKLIPKPRLLFKAFDLNLILFLFVNWQISSKLILIILLQAKSCFRGFPLQTKYYFSLVDKTTKTFEEKKHFPCELGNIIHIKNLGELLRVKKKTC